MTSHRSDYVCRVCGSTSLKGVLRAKEMMFGSRDEFDYDECADCGSLQIAAIPDDATIAAAYPSDYYSFSARSGSPQLRHGIVRRLSDRLVYSPLPRLRRATPTPVEILRAAGVKKSASILDVGCGSGAFLDRLKHIGFTSLCGADPFLDADGSTGEGVSLFKRTLAEMQGSFDVIMFNHSLEHAPSPADTLRDARAKLNSAGICVVRIPTPSSDVFAQYGASWAQIDAPRHMTLISRPGMAALAAATGFELRATIDDQRPWSLVASQSFANDIPMKGDIGKPSAALARLTAQANAAGRGDQAAFILRLKAR